MPIIAHQESNAKGSYVLTKELPILDARREIEDLANKRNLQVADMPLIVRAIVTFPNLLQHVQIGLNTLSTEYVHKLEGNNYNYFVTHRCGEFSTLDGLERMLGNRPHISRYFDSSDNFKTLGVPMINTSDIVRPGESSLFTCEADLPFFNSTIPKNVDPYTFMMNNSRLLGVLGYKFNRLQFLGKINESRLRGIRDLFPQTDLKKFPLGLRARPLFLNLKGPGSLFNDNYHQMPYDPDEGERYHKAVYLACSFNN